VTGLVFAEQQTLTRWKSRSQVAAARPPPVAPQKFAAEWDVLVDAEVQGGTVSARLTSARGF